MNNMVGFLILSVTIFIGFYAPKPPGLLGMMIEYYWLGGKERREKENLKWKKLNNIDRVLKKRGSDLVHEIIKKQGQ
jgi:hypothetical protein